MNKLRALRAERQLSISELAAGANINPATISLIENGHRKAQVSTAGKLASFFKVPVEVFSDLVDNTAAARGSKGQAARQAKERAKQHPISIDAALLAELDASDADGVEFNELESEADTDAFLDRLESRHLATTGNR